MAAVCTLLLLAFVLMCNVSYEQMSEVDLNKEESGDDWWDPTDMINYDLATGKMRNSKNRGKDKFATTSSKLESDCESSAPYKTCQSTVTELQSQVSSFNGSVTKLSQQVSRCAAIHQEMFFHQYIRSLLMQLSKLASPCFKMLLEYSEWLFILCLIERHDMTPFVDAPDHFELKKSYCVPDECEDDHYQVHIHMSSTQYKYLQDYVNQKHNSTAEVHSILASMLRDFRWESCFVDSVVESTLWQQAKEWLWIAAEGILLICCTIWLFINVPRSASWVNMRRLLSASFTISIPWTWWRLYKKEVAKRHADVFRSMPESCWSGHKSLWTFMTSWFWNHNSECVRHFESVDIDPMWEVPPTKAIAVTFVTFFLEPASYIGEALNRLVTAAFEHLPFHLWLPVFSLIVLLIVLAMFFTSGYQIRGWLWNIEPHRPVRRFHQLQQEKQALQDETQELQKQLDIEQRERTEHRASLEIGLD